MEPTPEKSLKEARETKKLLLIGLILGLSVSHSYAQMSGQTGGTGKEKKGRQKGQMMEQKGMMGQMEKRMSELEAKN